MKHKHAELIHAWADGSEIQVFHPNLDTWEDCTYDPTWNANKMYRIKPEPKPELFYSTMRLNLELRLECDRPLIKIVSAEVIK